MFQAQVGTLKSTPRLTKINGDDHNAVIYRNVGNHHAYPFVWANTATISGTASEVLVASGIKWHGYDLASYANVTVTPLSDPGDVRIWVEKDTDVNTIKIKSSAALGSTVEFDVKFMLGGDMSVEGLYCRGFGNPAQSLP
jgi:hypothetical protein